MGGARCEAGGSSDGPGPGPRRPPWPPASACRPAPGSRVRGSLGYARLSRAHPLPFALRCGAGLRASAGQGHRADVQPPAESQLPLGTRYAVAVPTLTRSSGSSRTGVNPKAYERGDYVTEAPTVLPGHRASHLRGRVTVTADVSSPVTHASLSQGRASRSGSSFRSPLRPPTPRRRAASAGWGLPCISETGGGGCPCPASVVPELWGRAGASQGLQARAGWGSSREAPESLWVAAFLATEMPIFGVT